MIRDVLNVYGVSRKLLDGMKAFYRGDNASDEITREVDESFRYRGSIRQGCVMSPQLFSLSINAGI